MIAKHVTALGCGALFGFGLAVSQMANPAKVVGFLDVAGGWDPSLAVVLAAALAVVGLAFRFVAHLRRPVFETAFEEAHPERIDRGLVAGAALFGIGWGLAGYCPGPGIVAVGRLAPDALLFVGAFLAGSWFCRYPLSTGSPAASQAKIPPSRLATRS